LSITLTRPPSDDPDFAAQIGHRRRPQEPRGRRDRRAPVARGSLRLDFGSQQARNRAALQPRKGTGGERRRTPVMGRIQRVEDRQAEISFDEYY
jgi:hypothetical protein